MSVLVITGTCTGVGKTVVTAALAAVAAARGTSVAVVKPGQTGVDPGRAGRSGRRPPARRDRDVHEFARFPDPLSPAAAARLAGTPPVRLPQVAERVRALSDDRRLVLVEGAGGLLVRYDEEGGTIADLARWLGAAVVVVARPDLGTLNHTALTLEAMAHRGVQLAGVVIGAWPDRPDLAQRSNIRDLETIAARPLAGALPAGAAPWTPPSSSSPPTAAWPPRSAAPSTLLLSVMASDSIRRTRERSEPENTAAQLTHGRAARRGRPPSPWARRPRERHH
ncbi:dethiobiotin synthase [Actinomadura sp. CNU-125]|uniref:dethiobiotin synthase n=1 Tax=Actinomadura sp. CNU-125 TaxID=1904961 RepID=UPI0021CCE2CD|nr:dethiobiotin synthase [Actinomadura sp. CNU-125]